MFTDETLSVYFCELSDMYMYMYKLNISSNHILVFFFLNSISHSRFHRFTPYLQPLTYPDVVLPPNEELDNMFDSNSMLLGEVFPVY